MKKYHAKELADAIKLELIGEDCLVSSVGTIKKFYEGSLIFLNKYNEDYLRKINNAENVFVIAHNEYYGKLTCAYVIADNPRLSFLRLVNRFFYQSKNEGIHPTAIISKNARIGRNVQIGAYSILDGDISIGDNTKIGAHVSIFGKVTLGHDCWIKSGAVIGEEGFGFERNEKGQLEHFPHIGEIIIGNNVFLGANSTIERGTIDATIINDGVAVDDLTQIGHNVVLGKNTTVACGAVLCGGVILGENCSVAPNVSVKQKLTVGDNCLLGLGTVCLKNIPSDKTIIGNPGRELKKSKIED